jgi:hypothetical protein
MPTNHADGGTTRMYQLIFIFSFAAAGLRPDSTILI